MIDPLYVLIAANVLLAGCILWLAVMVRRFHGFVTRLVAERNPEITPALIRVWRQKLSKLSPESPRAKEYRRRLAEVGERGD